LLECFVYILFVNNAGSFDKFEINTKQFNTVWCASCF